MNDLTTHLQDYFSPEALSSGSRRMDARLGGFMLSVVIVAALILSPAARREGLGLAHFAPESLSLTLSSRPLEVHVKDAASLSEVLSAAGYQLERVRAGVADVPRLLVRAFPGDLASLDSSEERKAVFIQSMLPLILQANEEIAADRARVLDLRDRSAAGEALAEGDQSWLSDLYARYGVADGDSDELLRRLDIVPVSLALGQSALESGWGTSRFAQEGNALFGQLGAPGVSVIKSLASPGPNGVTLFRSFDSLMGAVRSYVRNLNTNPAYRKFRVVRATLRHTGGEGRSLDGLKLVGALTLYSERGRDYLNDVRGLIRANKLQQFDQSRLAGGSPVNIRADAERPPHDA